MASNFNIRLTVKRGNLYIELKGDFDGSSAMQLLNELENSLSGVEKIFINTNDLKDIHPFGKVVFENHLSNGKFTDIVFTGTNRMAFQ